MDSKIVSRIFPKHHHDFARTNSLCPTPEEQLLDALKKNDRKNIKSIVEERPHLLNQLYTYCHKPILLIGCVEEEVEPETIQTLIDLGADLTYSSEPDEEWQPLHFAASATDSRKLQVIVNNLPPGKINDLAKGRNALHILIIYGNNENEDEFIKCAKILIEAGIDLDLGDANNISPILWAAKKGYSSIVKAILDNALVPVDIDTHTSRGKTARDLITEKNLYDKTLSDKSTGKNNNTDPIKILFSLVKQSNENGIINFNDGKIQPYVDAEDTSATILQYCCQKGLSKTVKHLLNYGANPNKTTVKNQMKPIEIAAEHGYFEIFKYLLDNPHVQVTPQLFCDLIKKQSDSEVYVLKKNENTFTYATIDHKRCYDILMKKLKDNKSLVDVNDKDERSNTPLHYAIRYAESDRIHELLGLGASLACKNDFGVMPVMDIEPDILAKHLDNCIEFDIKSKNFEKEDFTVTFNYRTLVPPQKIHHKCNMNLEYSDAESEMSALKKELTAEMEVISYMSKAIEFRHLLKHPIIVSFLFMKWHRIRWLFFTNLAFYVTFFLSLLVYIFSYYVNFNEEKSSTCIVFIHISFFLLCITFAGLILRELFQIAVSWSRYFTNLENYIEIVLIIVTGCILTSSSNRDAHKQLSSIAILLAAFELILMLGQHPYLSTNVVMLRTVSYNFFKFLLWYSILIIAFSISFYILFTDSGDNQHPNDTKAMASSTTSPSDDQEEQEENLFADPGKSVFKTIVMLTGEFDASDLNFHTYPILSKLIFVLFVFMIAIVLLNLLTGLAVSDTQMIKSDAELVGHIARAQHVQYVESMLMGNILPTSLMRFIRNNCCCCDLQNEKRNYSFKSLARKACIFPEVLSYELVWFPNRYGQVQLAKVSSNRRKHSQNACVGCWSGIYLDRETVKRTNTIIKSNKEEREKVLEKEKREEKNKHKEQNSEMFERRIREIQMEQMNINEKLDIILNYIYESGK